MQLRMKTQSSGYARNSLPVFFADVHARHPHTVRGVRRASNQVWPEIWSARRPRDPTSSFGTKIQCMEATNISPVGPHPLCVTLQKCLGLPNGRTHWTDRVAESFPVACRGLKCRPRTTSCLRPCGIRAPQTRWLDSDPRPTAIPMALDAFAALLLHIKPQPPGRRRVYGRLTILPHICKREGVDVG